MGRKSPLHDRQTATLEITPFYYIESSNFFPNYSNEDKLIAYGIRWYSKFTSSPMPYKDLVDAMKVFPNIEESYLFFVSKSGYTELVKCQAEIDHAVLLTIDDLFE